MIDAHKFLQHFVNARDRGYGVISHVPSCKADYQQFLVTQRWDTIYVRAQYAALSLGLQITSTQDTAHTFTAKRPTGQEVMVIIAPSGFGYLVTFKGTPAHDVTDVVRAYQQTTAF